MRYKPRHLEIHPPIVGGEGQFMLNMDRID
jgi:hypothetical protein